MFTFLYKYTDHATYLHSLAAALKTPVTDNTLWLPPSIGNGYIKVVILANGLQVLINETVINVDIQFIREATTFPAYTLRFDQVQNLKNLTINIDDDVPKESHGYYYSGAFLTDSLSSFSHTTNAGIEDRCINIYFTEEWFNTFSGVKTTDDFFQQYLSLKTAALNFEILNIEYRELMEEIFFLQPNHPVYKTVLQNRLMLLLEKFLRSLYNKKINPAKNNSEEADLQKLMQVEAILVKDLSVTPPAIPALAKVAMMSETKLKLAFKKYYGLNLYEYYQKSRMLKARQLLNKRTQSVKEVGLQLGFQNLSNFTIAYKKAFNVLPSNV